jgi:hypothetical protein
VKAFRNLVAKSSQDQMRLLEADKFTFSHLTTILTTLTKQPAGKKEAALFIFIAHVTFNPVALR